jgi:zinc protease
MSPEAAPPLRLPSIDFRKSTLANGIDVIVKRQAHLPLVAVNLWYHVGSKNEERRQRGFAHLFEHLMFEGSLHFPGDFFQPLQRLGAGVNGSTSSDRTNYFIDLPSAHVELAAAMESDRMANLLPALTPQKLRVQKDVVKNEYRQNYANRPYGQAGRILAEALYPPDHPYSWLTIGLMEDVEAATMEDVESFFRRFYVPRNASLCLVGDIDEDEALELAERYFGPIPGGCQAGRPWSRELELSASTDIHLNDRVELDRLYELWPTVPHFAPDDAALTLLADILGRGRACRLYRRLIVEEGLAQDVSVYHHSRELAGSLGVVVTLRPGRELARGRELVRAELDDLARNGPTAEELERAKNGRVASFVYALDNIGGFGGLADRLNAYNTYLGDPGRLEQDLERYLNVTSDSVRDCAARYLAGRPSVALFVHGRSQRVTAAPLDRSAPPAPRPAAIYAAPVPEPVKLACGAELWVIPRRDLPMIAACAALPAGAALHGPGHAGLAHLTSIMLDEGTTTRSTTEIGRLAEQMGTSLSTSAGWDGAYVSLQCLTPSLNPSLDLAIDVLLNPSFPDSEWTRIRGQALASLAAERDSADAMAHRVLIHRLYAADHPFRVPVDGTTRSVAAIARDQLQQFHWTHYRPVPAAWIVAGDVDLDHLARLLDDRLADWKLTASTTAIQPAGERAPTATRGLALFHRSGAPQAVVRAGQIGVHRLDPDHDALLLWNQILGGQFTSRLNEKLREEKGMTYGIRSGFDARRMPGPFTVSSSLQNDRLAEALADIRSEIEALLDHRPPTQQELNDARRALVEGQARHFENPAALVSRYASLFIHGLPPWHHAGLARRLESITVDDVIAASCRHVRPESLVFALVADAEIVRQPLEALGWGPVEVIDETLLGFEGRKIP